jgi:hypothetical protein
VIPLQGKRYQVELYDFGYSYGVSFSDVFVFFVC